ncbi:MAG: hypothetical protein ACOYN0_19445, partial [Phycisphaerales bacterium]
CLRAARGAHSEQHPVLAPAAQGANPLSTGVSGTNTPRHAVRTLNGMDIRRTDDVALRVAVLRMKAQVRDTNSGDPHEGRDHSGVVRLPKLVKAVLTRESDVAPELLISGGSVQLSGVIRSAKQIGELIVPGAAQRPVWGGASGLAAPALARVYASRPGVVPGTALDLRA